MSSARRRALFALAFALVALGVVLALRFLRPVPPLAELTARTGRVASAHGSRSASFREAAVGTTFEIGDAVKTQPASTARVRFDDASILDVRPSTLIRFSTGQRRTRPRIDVVTGEAWLVTATDIVFETLAGRTRLSAGSRIRLRGREDGGLALFLRIGQARIETRSGLITLAAGESLDLDSAGRRRRAMPASVVSTPPPSSSARSAPLATEGPSILASRVDMTMGIDEALVVRDLHPPTAIGITTSAACPSGAVVEWLADAGSSVIATARGSGTIPIAFPEGARRFRVRCREGDVVSDTIAGHGRVRVMRSSGQAALPRAAPETPIETDGRTYNVMYQNQSPALSVHWPGGPSGEPIVLVAVTASGTRRVNLHAPHHRFGPGALPDGSVRLHFEAVQSGRRSRETRVSIRFDPAAASASLEGPSDGSFAAGGMAHVGGMALAGWTVRAGSTPVPVGPDHRFAMDVPVPPNGVLVIALTRPGQGTHLYVRRASGVVP